MPKCEKCGDEEKTLYHGYCYSCYEAIWDRGFESTSEHAYDIGFHQEHEKFEGKLTKKGA